MKLRQVLRVVHRDLGYFFAGLLVIYAISGLALNHVKDWRPNTYTVEKEAAFTEAITASSSADEIKMLLEQVDESDSYKRHFSRSESLVIALVHGGAVEIDIAAKKMYVNAKRNRPILYEMNFLHYNSAREWWTWYADFFAVGLLLIVFTGMFLSKGSTGFLWRGFSIGVAGLISPVMCWILYLV